MDKPWWASKTIVGGTVAAVSGLVYAWAAVLGWSGPVVDATIATIGAAGTLVSLYGLRSALDR